MDDVQKLQSLVSNQIWRLENLYYILDVHGNKVKFKLNWAQKLLFKNLHYVNCILKARQLGMTTFIQIYLLDSCLFNSNHTAGVIAQDRETAEDIFKNKIKFAYDNLPEWIKNDITAVQDSARKMEFSNGSSIIVGTSLRGGTYQKLHISEYGKISARYPEKAREIKTGALNTVHVGQQIFVESTAEGNNGEFYELCMRAIRLAQSKTKLTVLDPKLHFFPWFMHPEYKLENVEVSINQELNDYFDSLPIELKPEQKSWYVKKLEQQGEDMKREFPSTPKEAFEQSMEGAYFTRQMAHIRTHKQITSVPYEPSIPVDTWWDLGMNDMMTIWFFQQVGKDYRFIRYFEDNGEGIQYYVNYLKSLGYFYGTHYWPHDGNIRDLSTGKTRADTARSFGMNPLQIVERTKSINDDIQALRNVLPRCWFDEKNCSKGIVHLDSYRKEWDDKRGTWKDRPLHDDASHGVDPLRLFAQRYNGRLQEIQRFQWDTEDRPQFAETEFDLFFA